MRCIWVACVGCILVFVPSRASAQETPPGVRKMAGRLQAIARAEDPMDNPFRNRERAEILAGQVKNGPHPGYVWQMLPKLAEEQLKAGQLAEALGSYRRFDELTDSLKQVLSSRQLLPILHAQAVCHLRLGEQQNCLTNHTIESCLFPIRPLGVYQQQQGPREAIKILSETLKRYTSDAKSLWLLNIAYMTIGEYPDKVPPQWLIPPQLFQSDYDIKNFTDVSSGAGLDFPTWAGGSVMEDFDGDGFLDLMVSNWEIRGQLRFFRNNGDGSFSERTRQAGLMGEVGGLNMVHADYNNDGHPDVLILRGAWLGAAGKYPNSLLRNNANGTFEDVTEEAGLLSFHPTQTAAWLDFNNDGWIDLFIGNESYRTNVNLCELYRNNGNGTFTECAAAAGVAIDAFVKGVAAGDFNNDGKPDLYLSTRGTNNFLLRNEGVRGPATGASAGWWFTNVATAAGTTGQVFSFPTGFFDFNNDGWLDILVTGYGLHDIGDVALDYLRKPFRSEKPRLFLNNRDGTFKDITADAKLDKLVHAMGLNFVDFDNDGWIDFHAGTGDPDFSTLMPNRAFRNAGGKFFQDVTTSGGLGHLQKGHAISVGDLDHDGDQDIFEVIGGAYSDDTYRNALFENPGHGNHWLTLKLEGVKCNRAAIGARIKVTVRTSVGERAVHRVVSTGASFGSSTFRQQIGLGDAQAIEKVEILWPVTGQTQVLRGLALDRHYTVREGDAEAKPWALRPYKMRPPKEELCAPRGIIAPAKPPRPAPKTSAAAGGY